MAVGGIIKKCEIIKKYWISILCGGMSPCAFFSFFYVLFCKAVFPCSFQKVFQQLGIEIFHLWMKDKNVTAFSTHILSDVERLSTDVAFLNNGKIVKQGTVTQLKNSHRTHQFIVETIKAVDADYLSDSFDNIERIAKDTLVFTGGQDKMFEVLTFITEHKIATSKIERSEPSLESLFMEVVAK